MFAEQIKAFNTGGGNISQDLMTKKEKKKKKLIEEPILNSLHQLLIKINANFDPAGYQIDNYSPNKLQSS